MKSRVYDWPKLKFHPGLKLSDRTFARLCGANRDLRLERTARGELVIMPPVWTMASLRILELGIQIFQWNEQAGLGRVFGSSAGFTLPNSAIRSPNASWLAQDRWDALTAEQKAGFAPLSPDFVAEVRSPTDRRATLRAKLREYIAQGSRLGWLIDPLRREVEVYRPGQPVELLEDPRTLSGEDVLPGLTLDLKGILFD